MDIFLVDLKFGHIHFYTPMSVLVFQPVFCFQLYTYYTPYICSVVYNNYMYFIKLNYYYIHNRIQYTLYLHPCS